MADSSTCTAASCRTVVEGIVKQCPTCGRRMLTSRRVRVLGWLLVGCGVFLLGLMGAITWMLYPSLSQPGVEVGDGPRFTGTAEQAAFVLNLFWLVLGFGALSLVNGVWQIVTGRRNILFMGATLLLAAVLIATAWETKGALGG